MASANVTTATRATPASAAGPAHARCPAALVPAPRLLRIKTNHFERRKNMSGLFIKGVLATALALGAVNSFAQDFQVVGVTCADGQCKCDNGNSGNPSQCCGTSTCSLSGGTCTCT